MDSDVAKQPPRSSRMALLISVNVLFSLFFSPSRAFSTSTPSRHSRSWNRCPQCVACLQCPSSPRPSHILLFYSWTTIHPRNSYLSYIGLVNTTTVFSYLYPRASQVKLPHSRLAIHVPTRSLTVLQSNVYFAWTKASAD